MLLNSWVNICLVPFFLFWYCCECTHSTSLAATTSNRTLSKRVVCGTSPIAVCAQHHSALCLVRLNVPWEDSHVYCYYDFTGYFIATIAISCVIWNGRNVSVCNLTASHQQRTHIANTVCDGRWGTLSPHTIHVVFSSDMNSNIVLCMCVRRICVRVYHMKPSNEPMSRHYRIAVLHSKGGVLACGLHTSIRKFTTGRRAHKLWG